MISYKIAAYSSSVYDWLDAGISAKFSTLSRLLPKFMAPMMGIKSVHIVNGSYAVSWGSVGEVRSVKSLSKTVTALLLGMAIEQKLGKDWNPEDVVYLTVNSYLRSVGCVSPYPDESAIANSTLIDLLTMRSGISCNEATVFFPNLDNDTEKLRMAPDHDKHLSELVQDADQAGKTWQYDSRLTHVLGRLIELTVGKPVLDFAKEELFRKIGVDDSAWRWAPFGRSLNFHAGLDISAEGLGTLGILIGNEGRIGHEQVVSPLWLSSMFSRRVEDSELEARFKGLWDFYGYQSWGLDVKSQDGTIQSAPGANGLGGQRLVVLPDRTVIVIQADLYDPAMTKTGLSFPEKKLVHAQPKVLIADLVGVMGYSLCTPVSRPDSLALADIKAKWPIT